MKNISSQIVFDALPKSVVISEILLRLPAEDILRCRAVRKSWRHATSTHDFLLEHHHRQPSLPVINLIKREGNLFDHHLFVYFDASPGALSRKLSQQTILWEYSNPFPYKDNPVIHGSCDGLLVVSKSEKYFDVCNPITGQRAPLPLTRDHEDGLPVTGIRIVGIYQHLASEEYRVLYSVCTRNDGFFTSKVDFHVLTVGYNESRPIKEPPLQKGLLDRLACSKNAPVKHVNLHWLLARYYTSVDISNIIVFDTEVETFRWMGGPPCQYPWISLLKLDGALAMCSSLNGIVMIIYAMHDYKAEVWAPTYHINLSALEASPQLDLPARARSKIATLNGRELLIELPDCVLHCDLDGKFLGKMECDERKDQPHAYYFFRFQESLVPLPFFGMQEDYGDNVMPEDEGDDEVRFQVDAFRNINAI